MSRDTYGGMDFEFENKTGPVDARSPFAMLGRQHLQPSTKKRNYSAFDSPPKSRTAQTSPNKPLPAMPLPAFNSLFNTPRKTQNDFDDSSAGETPRSPEQNNDSDATPDRTNMRSAISAIDAAAAHTLPGAQRLSPTKERHREPRRDSWMAKMKDKLYSPGRGEVPRADYSGALEKRVEKRRKREIDRIDRKVSRRRRHSMSDSGDDSERPRTSPRKISSQQSQVFPDQEKKPFWLTSLFTFIAQHPTVPHILSWYAQLAFNMFLLCGCAYLFYCFWSAVQGDVDKKSQEAMIDIMAEMAICAQSYTQNRCERDTRVPAMEVVCENWAKCMSRDPARVGRAKVSAHTFAEIFNSFVEPISYKAMAFTCILIFGCFGISNFAFGLFRKTENMPQQFQAYYQQQQQPPPPTPQRTFSGQEGFYAGTPAWQPQQGLEPQPSDGYGQIDGRGSPVRRLQY